MFAVIDDETAGLLAKLRSWKPGEDIKFDDFMSLAVVMAFQRNRTPQVRRLIADRSAWMTMRAGQPTANIINDTHIDLVFKSLYNAADEFSTRQLELWDDPRGRFITCDNPVLYSNDDLGTPPSTLTSRYLFWPISPNRCIAFGLELQGCKVMHRIARTSEISQVRQLVIRGAEEAIIALPGDLDLPSGKVLHRRPQVQIDCEVTNVEARECRLRFGQGYGPKIIDLACQPLCAMRPLTKS